MHAEDFCRLQLGVTVCLLRQHDALDRNQSSTPQTPPYLRAPPATYPPSLSTHPLISATPLGPRPALHVHCGQPSHILLEYQRHPSLPPTLHPAHHHLPQTSPCLDCILETCTAGTIAPGKSQEMEMAARPLPPGGQDRPDGYQDSIFPSSRRQCALGLGRWEWQRAPSLRRPFLPAKGQIQRHWLWGQGVWRLHAPTARCCARACDEDGGMGSRRAGSAGWDVEMGSGGCERLCRQRHHERPPRPRYGEGGGGSTWEETHLPFAAAGWGSEIRGQGMGCRCGGRHEHLALLYRFLPPITNWRRAREESGWLWGEIHKGSRHGRYLPRGARGAEEIHLQASK